MGNCLVVEEKVVRVMKISDGKILEYKHHPVKVHQVLSQFSHHAISEKLPIVKNMHPNSEMLRGHLYYLHPLPVPIKTTTKKKAVRFSDEVGAPPSGVVRIKVVISKKELKRMVSEGEVRVDDLICKDVQKDESINKDNIEVISKGWSPALDSIPEINTLVLENMNIST